MALKQFVTLNVADSLLSRIQDNVARALAQLLAVLFLDGRLVTGVSLNALSATSLNHGLGRVPLGWWVVSPNADARIWQSQPPDAKTLSLAASATVGCSVWVF